MGQEEMARGKGLTVSVRINSSCHLPCNRDRRKIVTPALRALDMKFALWPKGELVLTCKHSDPLPTGQEEGGALAELGSTVFIGKHFASSLKLLTAFSGLCHLGNIKIVVQRETVSDVADRVD